MDHPVDLQSHLQRLNQPIAKNETSQNPSYKAPSTLIISLPRGKQTFLSQIMAPHLY